MSAERLRQAAKVLRGAAEGATDRTIRMSMVRGVYLNSAHYLTTTPEREIATADLLDDGADYLDWVTAHHPEAAEGKGNFYLTLADAILGGVA